MYCDQCGNKMVLLLLTVVCDTCEGRQSNAPELARGYIVWRSRPPGTAEYVFRTRHDAERWRAAAGLDRYPIRTVFSRVPFKWTLSTGSVRDIEWANRMFEVFPSEDHEPGPNRVFLD